MRRELCCAHDLASVASARFSLKSNERQRDLLTLASSHVDFASSLLPWLPALPNDRPTHDHCAPVHGSPDPGYLHYLHTHTASFLPCLLAQGLSASHIASVGKSSVHPGPSHPPTSSAEVTHAAQITTDLQISHTKSNLVLQMANGRAIPLSSAYHVPRVSRTRL